MFWTVDVQLSRPMIEAEICTKRPKTYVSGNVKESEGTLKN